MSQPRVVQLSPPSLALVFAQDKESSRTASSASGGDIFADFKAQNMRSFWNKRLVKAMTEVHFQGWMENFVLVVQGNANHLEVLREAWMRRALRSPRGFTIRAVGDLSPVQMAPITQSQFIPLSEVLCSVISDMNTAHTTVSQEALFSHMMKAYPGMTIPTQDILYNALGSLIKERKIYHTGEGYFIVTPQTYFITNSVVKDKHWWTSAENDPPSPPPITYLVSSESCVESSALPPPEPPPVAHCKSCSCFSTSAPDQHSVTESTARSLKWPRDPKPSIQHQATSTAAHYQPSEMSKSTTSRKDKEKDKEKVGRKFGLSFFRRNAGKKEKPRKEYATFSGQFPPAEWPVRDEDDLNNLPRDLEHAIIRRINPELTVDNLVRHTVLMKRLEEKGGEKAVDRGVSTEILASKQGHPSDKPGKRSTSRTARSKKRARSSREKQKQKRKGLSPDDPGLDLGPSPRGLEVDETVPPAHPHPTADPKNVLKMRIENPFLSRSGLQRKPEESRQTGGSKEHTGYRSKSWDPSQNKKPFNTTGTPLATKDRSCETLDTQPEKELLGDYSSSYPETSTLRIEDKNKKLTETKVRGRGLKDHKGNDTKYKTSQDENARGRLHQQYAPRQTNIVDLPAHPVLTQISHQISTAVSPYGPNPSTQHLLGLSAQQQRPGHYSSHTPQPLKSSASRADSGQTESDSFTDEDQMLYQREVEEDDDACSSLYLNEDSMNEGSEVSHSERILYQQSSAEGDGDSTFVEGGVHQGSVLGTNQQVDCRWHEPSSQQPSSLCVPARASLAPPRPGGEAEPRAVSLSGAPGACQGSEVDSDTETLHRSADEAELQGAAGSPCPAAANQSVPTGGGTGEAVENHSSTGDSGIDSPRTQGSLASSGAGIADGLKQQVFLQDLEKLHSRHSQKSLLQLTPTMNV